MSGVQPVRLTSGQPSFIHACKTPRCHFTERPPSLIGVGMNPLSFSRHTCRREHPNISDASHTSNNSFLPVMSKAFFVTASTMAAHIPLWRYRNGSGNGKGRLPLSLHGKLFSMKAKKRRYLSFRGNAGLREDMRYPRRNSIFWNRCFVTPPSL